MSSVMFIHVVFGTLAVLLGSFALFSKKGTKFHRTAGKMYVVTMLLMAVSGLLAAIAKEQMINVFAALLTCYLVLTAWHAAIKRQIENDKWVVWACLSMLVVGISGCVLGIIALYSAEGGFAGFSYVAYFFIAGVALFAGLLDLYVLITKRLSEKQRQVRHIWRMSFSYFIAAGSLFTGPGASAFPESIRNSGILGLPEPVILIVMLFFVVKTFLATQKKKRV